MKVLIRLTVGGLIAGVLAAALVSPAHASAAACPIGGSGVSYNRLDEPAHFKSLTPMRGMNCASAQYVMNKWLRRAYQRQWSNRIPTRFWDGYVTWRCWKLTGYRWQCDEYDSNTSFRFTAYRF